MYGGTYAPQYAVSRSGYNTIGGAGAGGGYYVPTTATSPGTVYTASGPSMFYTPVGQTAAAAVTPAPTQYYYSQAQPVAAAATLSKAPLAAVAPAESVLNTSDPLAVRLRRFLSLSIVLFVLGGFTLASLAPPYFFSKQTLCLISHLAINNVHSNTCPFPLPPPKRPTRLPAAPTISSSSSSSSSSSRARRARTDEPWAGRSTATSALWRRVCRLSLRPASRLTIGSRRPR